MFNFNIRSYAQIEARSQKHSNTIKNDNQLQIPPINNKAILGAAFVVKIFMDARIGNDSVIKCKQR